MAKKEKVVKSPSCTFVQLQALGVQGLTVGSAVGQVVPRTFESGSYGLGYAGPCVLQLPDGSVAECQASINIVVKHSKNKSDFAKFDEAVAAPADVDPLGEAEAA